MDEPLQEHVRRLRLERAALRLKFPEQTVTEIALDAGYESHEAFTRAFHAMFGMPPSQFRASHEYPAAPSGVHFNNTASYHAPQYGMPAVELKSFPPQRMVFLRHRGPYAEVGSTWGRLAMWAGQRGLFGPAARFIGIAWDDPQITPADKLRYDAAITIDRPVTAEGDIGVGEIAGGEYATVTHQGPYEELGRAYQAIMGAWLPASGRDLRDVPCFELYVNTPQTTAPKDLLTVLHIPV